MFFLNMPVATFFHEVPSLNSSIKSASVADFMVIGARRKAGGRGAKGKADCASSFHDRNSNTFFS